VRISPDREQARVIEGEAARIEALMRAGAGEGRKSGAK
jgi:hypothetical protein